MVRSIKGAEALSALEGAEVVVGDFDDEETVARALQGISPDELFRAGGD